MNERELNNLSENVRKQGLGENTMTDLVYDPATGEFKQVSKNETPGQGEVVTRMTEEGFALRLAA
ncbi:MAG: hypothetical protein J5985_04530 [Kiritimatiellae bacterium]|nr:hypothetical protein [Kiritimatiellia bacterium]